MEGFSGRAVPGRTVKGDRVPGDGKGEPSPVTAGTLTSLLPGGPTEPAQQASAAGLVWNEALDGAGQAGRLLPGNVGENVKQLLGNTAAGHQSAGKHEQRDGQDGGGIQAVDHGLYNIVHVAGKPGIQELGNDGRDTHGNAHGKRQYHGNQENTEYKT